MEKIALLYAPAKGNTEKIAQMLYHLIGEDKIDMILIEDDTDPEVISGYSRVIFGISTVGRDTWDSKYKKIAWDFFIPKLEKTKLHGKKVAIFGLGDHLLYRENFVDSMGTLGNQLIKCGAEIIGQTPTVGYSFSNSEAIINDMFIGLPIDEDNEPELTNKRLESWLIEISSKMGF